MTNGKYVIFLDKPSPLLFLVECTACIRLSHNGDFNRHCHCHRQLTSLFFSLGEYKKKLKKGITSNDQNNNEDQMHQLQRTKTHQ